MRARVATLFLLFAALAFGETGRDAWLRDSGTGAPPAVTAFAETPVIASARAELLRGLHGGAPVELRIDLSVPEDGFRLKASADRVVIAGGNDRGVLYGAFALLRKLQLGQPLDGQQSPKVLVRWVNEWNNLDGSIERGYGGRSIFWDRGRARTDLSRAAEYARLLASLGINGCAINNVNADRRAITAELLPDVARIAAVFRPWGVRIALAVDFGSPKTLGGLETFDPLDPRVAEWWRAKVDEIYRAVPDLGGIVLKADSEGRVGPSAYGRTHADAANVIARALSPHKGILFYRGFVYDHHMDWRNLKNDRARAAYDNFKELDGKFEPNVIVQIKHGPIDFQVREPASPLLSALQRTNTAVELQITQEYFGQARHTVFLVPMWKEALAGADFARAPAAFTGVSNVGLDESWFGNHLSQANLYGFGRLAWNPDLTAEQVSDEWTRLTFGSDARVREVVNRIQLSSWRTYENYTGPLGLQTLTDIVGNHYGVSVEASERNGWGQWHRADAQGVGMDRTMATGTGFIGQYRAGVAQKYESLATCPDDLLLFMHHVPYQHKLHEGRTVIQYLYDSHYDGSAAVEQYVRDWRTLAGRIDAERYRAVLAQLEYQAGQAELWRDAVVSWFLRESGIADEKGRAGNHPGRVEAEAMELDGYAVHDVWPWETASGGKLVECVAEACAARFRYDGPAGTRTMSVRYFDQSDGVSRFRLLVAGKQVDEWVADLRLPTRKPDGTSSTRRLIRNVVLNPGDEVRLEGIPERGERAGLDYIEILPPIDM